MTVVLQGRGSGKNLCLLYAAIDDDVKEGYKTQTLFSRNGGKTWSGGGAIEYTRIDRLNSFTGLTSSGGLFVVFRMMKQKNKRAGQAFLTRDLGKTWKPVPLRARNETLR